MTGGPAPRDAATVLLLRDAARGLEVFMVKRNAMVDFMAGAHVFPGGKVDAADAEPALLERLRGARDPAVAPELYVAAVRETFEEAGVLLGAGADAAALARSGLLRGAAFVEQAASLEVGFDADRLVLWTRWVTPLASPKRFDARFFLAAAPPDQEASHDEGETTASGWFAPGEALELAARGEMLVAPATFKCLAVLAQHGNVDAAFAAARAQTARTWCPVIRNEAGRRLVILSDDPEHPDRYARMPGPTRMAFEGGRFVPV